MAHPLDRLELRPVGPDDAPFLRALYAAARADEMAGWGWSAEQTESFVDQQYEARQVMCSRPHGEARDDLILLAGIPVGRLLVHRTAREIRLVDIALLPAYRGMGVGTTLLTALIKEAGIEGTTLALHVESENPARRLYRRLGLIEVAETPPYVRMESRPAIVVSPAPTSRSRKSSVVN